MAVKRKLSFKRNAGRKKHWRYTKRMSTVRRRARNIARYTSRRIAPTRANKRMIRNVAITAGEKKYTAFTQLTTTEYTLGNGATCLTLDCVAGNVDVFPPEGITKGRREGERYLMLGLNCVVFIKAVSNNVSTPLSMYLVRAPQRHTVTNGGVSTSVIFPQTLTTDFSTWPTLPVKMGMMEAGYGTIIRRWTFYPSRKVTPESGAWQTATAIDDDVAEEPYRPVNFFIPIRKRIKCTSTASEVPFDLSKYYLLFHCNVGATSVMWNVRYLYTQCVFKDY